VLIGWLAGVAGAALSFGIIAKGATGSVPEPMADLLDKFGVQGTFLRQYLGIAFVMMAALVALLPASQIGASVDEEMSGRLTQVLAQPARRATLFAGRVVIGSVAVLAAGVIAGLFAWLGAKLQGVDPGFARMLGAGTNLVPTALVVFGIGAVVRSIAPRLATGCRLRRRRVVLPRRPARLLGGRHALAPARIGVPRHGARARRVDRRDRRRGDAPGRRRPARLRHTALRSPRIRAT